MGIKFHKAIALPGSPTSADDGVYLVKANTEKTFSTHVIDDGEIYHPNNVKYNCSPAGVVTISGTAQQTISNPLYGSLAFNPSEMSHKMSYKGTLLGIFTNTASSYITFRVLAGLSTIAMVTSPVLSSGTYSFRCEYWIDFHTTNTVYITGFVEFVGQTGYHRIAHFPAVSNSLNLTISQTFTLRAQMSHTNDELEIHKQTLILESHG